MKFTKANMIKLLKAKAENAYEIYCILKNQPIETPEIERAAKKMLTYHSAYYEVVNLMTEKTYFDEIAEIYFPGEE